MTPTDWRKAYIAGVVDNHCAIVITVGKDTDRAIGYRIAIECRMKLRSKETLTFVEDFCDSRHIAYRTKKKENQSYESYEFVIGRRSDIKEFLTQVQPYLIARDEAVELLCTTIIPRLEEGDHGERESFLDLMNDIEAFREKAGRSNRAKYDLQYFSEEWDIEFEIE